MPDPAAAHSVEVAAGTAERQVVIRVPWQAGLTAREALERSRIREVLPLLADLPVVLGRFGQPIDADTILEPGDRIDFCRPLVKDPRDMRRELLSSGSVMGRGKPWETSADGSQESE